MMWRISLFVAIFFAAPKAWCQTDNTIYVKQFPGATVGVKVANAMAACGANPAVPCILVIDPSLAASPAGTMPVLCSHCYVADYREGPPGSGGVIGFQSGTIQQAEALVPAGGTLDVKGTLTVAANHSTPSNVIFKMESGGSFSISPGAILSIAGNLTAGRYRIFFGSGSVSFAISRFVTELYPEWWGADPTGTNDSAPAFNAAGKAATTLGGSGGEVSCGGGIYILDNTVTVVGKGTANGVLFVGPDATYDNQGVCTIDWNGVNGGNAFHFIGGHMDGLKNVEIASRPSNLGNAVWWDVAQYKPTTPVKISSITRSSSSCVVTVTTSAAHGLANGKNFTVAGVADSSFDGTFPLWYTSTANKLTYSQCGANSTSSGGTLQEVQSSEDGPYADNVHVGLNPYTTLATAITSCSISSRVLTCRTPTPILGYPNQWVWISGSSDPVYNAYWQLTNVMATGFTAAAQEVVSEAATTTGTIYGPQEAFAIGSGTTAYASYSVSGGLFKRIKMVSAPNALVGYEFMGAGNVKNFTIQDRSIIDNFRIGILNILGGTFTDKDSAYGSLVDGLYVGNASSLVSTGIETEGGGYVFSGLVSGSYNASTNGTNGQFEVPSGASWPCSFTLLGDDFENGNYASDNVIGATTCNLFMNGNKFFFENSSTTVPMILLPSSVYNVQHQQITSIGNGYANANRTWNPGSGSVTNWAPFVTGSPGHFASVLSAGSQPSTPVTTVGDYGFAGNQGNSASPLQSFLSITRMAQYNQSAPYGNSSTSAVYNCQNNVACLGAEKSSGGNLTLGWGSDNALQLNGVDLIPYAVRGYQGSGTKIAVPVYGTATLSSGTVTVKNSAACNESPACVYRFDNCGKGSSKAIGTLSLGTVAAGTSFVIDSLSSSGSVATGDASTVCWSIN